MALGIHGSLLLFWDEGWHGSAVKLWPSRPSVTCLPSHGRANRETSFCSGGEALTSDGTEWIRILFSNKIKIYNERVPTKQFLMCGKNLLFGEKKMYSIVTDKNSDHD